MAVLSPQHVVGAYFTPFGISAGKVGKPSAFFTKTSPIRLENNHTGLTIVTTQRVYIVYAAMRAKTGRASKFLQPAAD